MATSVLLLCSCASHPDESALMLIGAAIDWTHSRSAYLAIEGCGGSAEAKVVYFPGKNEGAYVSAKLESAADECFVEGFFNPESGLFKASVQAGGPGSIVCAGVSGCRIDPKGGPSSYWRVAQVLAKGSWSSMSPAGGYPEARVRWIP